MTRLRPPSRERLLRVLRALAAEHPEDYVPPQDLVDGAGIPLRDVKTCLRHLNGRGHIEIDRQALWPMSARLSPTGRAFAARNQAAAARAMAGARS